MSSEKVLFISGSIGLGHVTRDLAIADALRARRPNLRLVWLAADPARQVLQAAGQTLVPESTQYAGETGFVERLAEPFSLGLTNLATLLKSPRALKGLIQAVRRQKANVALIKTLTGRERFDLVIGDEAYEIMLALTLKPALKPAPMAMIFDFIGLDVTSRSPLEWLSVQVGSWVGVRWVRRFPRVLDLTLFAGEEEDVADKPFGWRLPNRRQLAASVVDYVGYICPFEPADYQDRAALRARLGYGPEPLVICAIGGTAIGKPLLELCGRTYAQLRQALPDLRMVLVCGPRLAPEHLEVPAGVERKGYVHRLYEHFAACDVAIVQGGGTTTVELAALRRPFLYFPLAAHFEQQHHVAGRLARLGAGVKVQFQDTTPERLGDLIQAQLNAPVSYPPIRTDGARRAAEFLCQLMDDRRAPLSGVPRSIGAAVSPSR